MDSQAQTTKAAARPSVRSGLTAAVTICAATLLTATFEMSMADWPSSLVEMLLLPLTALLFLGCSVWSLTQLLRVRHGGAKFAAPFLVCAATLAILTYAPLQDIYLQCDFHWYRTAREAIVARIARGELKPNVDGNSNLIALGDNGPYVSLGDDIVVDEADEGTYVLFFTMRRLKHAFSGFLHVPSGSDPKKFFEFDDKPPSRLVPYGKDWYFVAN
ncbi:hypothetical protein [Bradyrhizobium genosp. P]|uniref:hypothetical protein n=1 Tax=Bradyrhizobium genosp. P TaxID=83641 RepID=UPI003CFA1114